MELVHVLSEQSSKPRKNLLVPGVVLEGHLLLYLTIVDLHWTKCLHCVSGINGLARFPIVLYTQQDQVHHYYEYISAYALGIDLEIFQGEVRQKPNIIHVNMDTHGR